MLISEISYTGVTLSFPGLLGVPSDRTAFAAHAQARLIRSLHLKIAPVIPHEFDDTDRRLVTHDISLRLASAHRAYIAHGLAENTARVRQVQGYRLPIGPDADASWEIHLQYLLDAAVLLGEMHDSGVIIMATRISSESTQRPLYGYTWCNETLKANEVLHKQVLEIKSRFERKIGIPLYNQLLNVKHPMSKDIQPIKEDLIEKITRNEGRLDSLADILTQHGRELNPTAFLSQNSIYPSLDTISVATPSTFCYASSPSSSATSSTASSTSTTSLTPTIRKGNPISLAEMQRLRKIAVQESKHTRRIQPPSTTTSDDTRRLTSEGYLSEYAGSYTAIRIPFGNTPFAPGFDEGEYPMRTQQPNTFSGYNPNHPMGPFLQLFCGACGIEPSAEDLDGFKERLRTVSNTDMELYL